MYLYTFTIQASQTLTIKIPVGVESMKVRSSISAVALLLASGSAVASFNNAASGLLTDFTFPISRYGSPCAFTFLNSQKEVAKICICVMTLGGTPDPYYFYRDENGIISQEAIQALEDIPVVYPTKLTADEAEALMNGGELTTPEPVVAEVTQSTTATVKTKTK